jgi:hypothetical protein
MFWLLLDGQYQSLQPAPGLLLVACLMLRHPHMKVLQGWVLAAALCSAGLSLWRLLACVFLRPHIEVLQGWVLAAALCPAGLWLLLLLLLACVLLHPQIEVLRWVLAAA